MQTLERAPAHAASEIKQLCELSSFQNVFFIVLEWMSILLVIYCTQKFFNPLTYLLAIVWIGSRFQALVVLMHEATHYRLFKNRKLNEFVGEFLAWPAFLTMKGYRNSHLAHHQNLNTEDDPDWNQWDKYYQFPKTKKQMIVGLIENALGIGFVYDITQTLFAHKEQAKLHNEIPLSLRICQLSFYATIVGASIAFSFWQLLILYWLVPLLTFTKFFDYVRAVTEHYPLNYSETYKSSRNTFGWERHIVAPYNICIHLDHHLHPGVPWYNLGKLHDVLMKDPEYRRTSLNSTGHFRVLLEECTQDNNG